MSKLIILDTMLMPKPNVKVCYWIDVPLGNQEFYANPNFTSMFRNASAQEIQDLQDGKMLEIIENHEFEIGCSLADMKAAIVTHGASLVSEVTNEITFQYYGVYYDGTWHNPT